MHHFIELHAFGEDDNRSIYINADNIVAVHASYANTGATAIVLKGLTGDDIDACCYEVNEDLDSVKFLIDAVYGGESNG